MNFLSQFNLFNWIYNYYTFYLLGFYTGILGSAFYFGQLCTSYAWGIFSDKYGAKSSLLIGLCAMFISTLTFGFSTNYYLAVFARFLAGFLNGNIGVLKV